MQTFNTLSRKEIHRIISRDVCRIAEGNIQSRCTCEGEGTGILVAFR